MLALAGSGSVRNFPILTFRADQPTLKVMPNRSSNRGQGPKDFNQIAFERSPESHRADAKGTAPGGGHAGKARWAKGRQGSGRITIVSGAQGNCEEGGGN